MRKISSGSFPCKTEETSELCLIALLEVSKLLETLSRLSLARISCLMPSMDISILAQLTWALECVHLSTLTYLAGLQRVGSLWRQDVRNFTCNPVEPEENLVDRLALLTTSPTSTDLATLRLNLSRR